MWHFADLRFANHIFGDLRAQLFFASIKLPQIRKYINFFLLTYVSLKCSHSNLRTFGFRDSFQTEVHVILQSKIYLRRKKNIRVRIWIRNCEALLFSLQIGGFAICGLIISNSQICDLQTGTSQNFADLGCGMNTRICGFAICGQTNKFACRLLLQRYQTYDKRLHVVKGSLTRDFRLQVCS